eukprot:gene1897-2237_t
MEGEHIGQNRNGGLGSDDAIDGTVEESCGAVADSPGDEIEGDVVVDAIEYLEVEVQSWKHRCADLTSRLQDAEWMAAESYRIREELEQQRATELADAEGNVEVLEVLLYDVTAEREELLRERAAAEERRQSEVKVARDRLSRCEATVAQLETELGQALRRTHDFESRYDRLVMMLAIGKNGSSEGLTDVRGSHTEGGGSEGGGAKSQDGQGLVGKVGKGPSFRGTVDEEEGDIASSSSPSLSSRPSGQVPSNGQESMTTTTGDAAVHVSEVDPRRAVPQEAGGHGTTSVEDQDREVLKRSGSARSLEADDEGRGEREEYQSGIGSMEEDLSVGRDPLGNRNGGENRGDQSGVEGKFDSGPSAALAVGTESPSSPASKLNFAFSPDQSTPRPFGPVPRHRVHRMRKGRYLISPRVHVIQEEEGVGEGEEGVREAQSTSAGPALRIEELRLSLDAFRGGEFELRQLEQYRAMAKLNIRLWALEFE